MTASLINNTCLWAEKNDKSGGREKGCFRAEDPSIRVGWGKYLCWITSVKLGPWLSFTGRWIDGGLVPLPFYRSFRFLKRR